MMQTMHHLWVFPFLGCRIFNIFALKFSQILSILDNFNTNIYTLEKKLQHLTTICDYLHSQEYIYIFYFLDFLNWNSHQCFLRTTKSPNCWTYVEFSFLSCKTWCGRKGKKKTFLWYFLQICWNVQFWAKKSWICKVFWLKFYRL